ncbi:MAG: aminoacyl-tRNA hydrolase [Candidatus Sumerlaeota bacterium]|nr:aminoacyl-tRNA hydrolase [Candidatus Sumerlaeota bacterium]
MHLIVGLGNPGRRYDGSPHNLGYEVVDMLTACAGLKFRASLRSLGLVARGMLEGIDAALLKPTTYMNLSGEAVSSFLRYHPVDLKELLVISDDTNLPMGRLRIREGGSHGGHKGLLSIIKVLGTNAFARLRIGVMPRAVAESMARKRQVGVEEDDLVRYVLTPLRGEERLLMGRMKELATSAVLCYLKEGVASAANKYNKKDLVATDTSALRRRGCGVSET